MDPFAGRPRALLSRLRAFSTIYRYVALRSVPLFLPAGAGLAYSDVGARPFLPARVVVRPCAAEARGRRAHLFVGRLLINHASVRDRFTWRQCCSGERTRSLGGRSAVPALGQPLLPLRRPIRRR